MLQTVWDRILPSVGQATAIAITERALALTGENFPLIERLKVGADGLIFDQLRDSMGEPEIGEPELSAIREALQALVAEVNDIVAILTGDILVN